MTCLCSASGCRGTAFQGACCPGGCFSISFCTRFPPRALTFGCLCQFQVLSALPEGLVSWQRLAPPISEGLLSHERVNGRVVNPTEASQVLSVP